MGKDLKNHKDCGVMILIMILRTLIAEVQAAAAAQEYYADIFFPFLKMARLKIYYSSQQEH